MKLKKLRHNKILVLPFEEKEYHGIILPDVGKDKPCIGMVTAVAGNIEDILVKDKVIFGKYAGMPIELEDTQMLLLDQQDIIATYE